MGTIEISKNLGINKATTSRILLQLTKRGFLQQNQNSKKFKLGPAAIDIGDSVIKSIDTGFVRIAQPFIDELGKELNETVSLVKLAANSALTIYVYQPHRLACISGNRGDRHPINGSAGAKAILAYLESDASERIIKAIDAIPPLTEKATTDPDLLMRQIKEVRRKGYSFCVEEIDIGVNYLAVPILDRMNSPIASLVVAGPSKRLSQKSVDKPLSKMKATANKISAELYQQ